ncbi:hypothetical protein FE257_006256 [Aspergillus nanangensis]|uniref:Uncharacterized protein n=1 Tax=Aspergillus nanangensis TaxID=2582783 RepID=A0AAD4GUX5_ASPNN|nr:hypothetical protein FE257_006256 [Aspergillus nanangensis]
MKFNLLVLLATATAGVFANPENSKRDDICHKPSSCSKFWSGKCEQYCDPYKFSHMSSDGCTIFLREITSEAMKD